MSGIPAWAVRGAKCIFIDVDGMGDWGDDEPHAATPEPNAILTVVKAVEFDDGVYVKTAEFPTVGIAVECLRPLVTRSQEQDMAIFRPILDQVQVDA